MSKSKVFGLWAAVVVGGFALIGFLSPSQEADNLGGNTAGALTACEAHVTKKLASPSTAKFESWAVGSVQPTGPNTYRLSSYVDSQNLFGAMVRTSYVCEAEENGSNWSVSVRLQD